MTWIWFVLVLNTKGAVVTQAASKKWTTNYGYLTRIHVTIEGNNAELCPARSIVKPQIVPKYVDPNPWSARHYNTVVCPERGYTHTHV